MITFHYRVVVFDTLFRILYCLKMIDCMYSLRHTFATRCEEAGISIKQTALWLGHSDIETTSKHYVGILSDFEQQNVIKKDLHNS